MYRRWAELWGIEKHAGTNEAMNRQQSNLPLHLIAAAITGLQLHDVSQSETDVDVKKEKEPSLQLINISLRISSSTSASSVSSVSSSSQSSSSAALAFVHEENQSHPIEALLFKWTRKQHQQHQQHQQQQQLQYQQPQQQIDYIFCVFVSDRIHPSIMNEICSVLHCDSLLLACVDQALNITVLRVHAGVKQIYPTQVKHQHTDAESSTGTEVSSIDHTEL